MNLVVFYHVWQHQDWELLFQQQIMNLLFSGLLDQVKQVYICCNGNQVLPIDHPKFIVKYNHHWDNESDTLNQLWKFSQFSPDTQVLYMHTQGVGYRVQTRLNKDSWRMFVEFLLIHQWKECVDKLKDHDVIGVQWMNPSMLTINHIHRVPINQGIFYGNFWWANTNYLKTLSQQSLYQYDYFHRHYQINIPLDPEHERKILRFNSELWVGSQSPRVYNIADMNMENIPFSMYNENVFNYLVKQDEHNLYY